MKFKVIAIVNRISLKARIVNLFDSISVPSPMLPSWMTDYSVSEFITRGFDNLDSICYKGELSRELQSRTDKGKTKVLFVGVGRGREAIEAQQRFGDNLEVTAINKKRGEFFSETGYKWWASQHNLKLSKEDVLAFRKVRANLLILDLEKQLDKLKTKFDMVIFGWGVSEYLWDCVKQYDVLLHNNLTIGGLLYTAMNSLVLVDSLGEKIEWSHSWLKRLPEDSPIKLIGAGVAIKAGAKIPFEHYDSCYEKEPAKAIPNVLSKYRLI